MGLRFWFLTGLLVRLPARAPGVSGAHRARSTPNGEEEAGAGGWWKSSLEELLAYQGY